MKILITAANRPEAYELAWLLKNENAELLFADDQQQQLIIAKETSPSYSHELLNFCLNNAIDYVFPLKSEEVRALTEAKVLFAEYGIHIAVPDLPSLKKLHNLEGMESWKHKSEIAATFSDLSAKMIAMGYPSEQIALTPADDRGDFLVIDDTVAASIWKKINAISFIQMGKLLNLKDFAPVKLFKLAPETELLQLRVLIWNDKISVSSRLNDDLMPLIQHAAATFNLQGYFRFTINNHTVLSISPYHL